MPPQTRRLGFIGLLITDRARNAPAVNELLNQHGESIIGRLGIPRATKAGAIITLIVESTTDEIGNLTGRLGQLPGVQVKSALLKS